MRKSRGQSNRIDTNVMVRIDYQVKFRLMVLYWEYFLAKKCNGVLLGVISGKKM